MADHNQSNNLEGAGINNTMAQQIGWVYSLSAFALLAGGLYAGSLALIASALLYVSYLVAGLMKSMARRLTRTQDDDHVVLGYGRLEVATELAGHVVVTILSASVIYLSIFYLFLPHQTKGWTVVMLAGIVLGFELLMIPKLASGSWHRKKNDISRPMRLGRLAILLSVLAGGAAILMFGSEWIDSIVAVSVSGLLLWSALSGIGAGLRLALMSTPPDLETADVVRRIRSVKGVQDIHHLHFWRLAEQKLAVDAHIVVTVPDWQNAEAIRDHIEAMLIHKFGIEHCTLEMETPDREQDNCHAYGG